MLHAAFLTLLIGCDQPESVGSVLSDHTLTDVNPTSATFDTEVAVSNFQGQVSAWYFGHST